MHVMSLKWKENSLQIIAKCGKMLLSLCHICCGIVCKIRQYARILAIWWWI